MMDMTGQLIGQYRIESLIGSSESDRVFRARDMHDDSQVAIKILNIRQSDDPHSWTRVLRQFRLVSELLHPNIIDVLDYGEHNGRLYMVMEFVPDGSLRSLQQRLGPHEPLPLYLGIDLLRQAAEGLAHAHNRGLIHRDIKPDNMLLSRVPGISSAFQLKLTDFGLAHLERRDHPTGLQAPTGLAYMSPEQHRGYELDGRSDIYSLGVVLFQTATGYLPFEAATPGDAAYKHTLTPPPSPREIRPDIPEELSSIILRCLEKDPAERFLSARELADALSVLMPDASPAQSTSAATEPMPHSDQPHHGGVRMYLDHEHMWVTPGKPETMTVTLENPGAFPVRVMLTSVGVSPEWVRLPPGVVDLPPRSQMNGPIHILVPRKPESYAGDYQLTVRSHIPGRTEPAADSSVQVSVAPFNAMRLHLEPPVTSGRGRGTFHLTLENLGNERRLVVPVGDTDPHDLKFEFEPNQMTLAPGDKLTSNVSVLGSRRWIGSGRDGHEFRVVATSSGSGGNDRSPPVRGTFVQQPQFPIWALPLFLLVLLGAGFAWTMYPEDDDSDVAGLGVTATVVDEAGSTPAEAAADPTATEESVSPASDTPIPDNEAEPTEPAPATEAPSDPTVEPTVPPVMRDVSLIAFTSARDNVENGALNIYVVEPDGSNLRGVIVGAGDDWSPAWSNDGTRIAWVSKANGSDDIYVANADGSDPVRLTDDPENDRFPVWSPDDSLIAFTRGDGNETELYVVSADGGEPDQLTSNSAFDGNPSWSPDGEQMVFVSNRTGSNEVYVMDADGSNVDQLTSTSGNNFNPNWSPNGERIVFLTDRDGDRDIYSFNADGTDEVPLVLEPEDEFSPVWSPDGEQIAFVRESGSGSADLYVMQADGSDEELITEDVYPDDPNLLWSPDGEQIAFLRTGDPAVDMYVVNIDDGEETRLTTNPSFDGNMTWLIVQVAE